MSVEPPCPLVAVATVFGCPPLDEGLRTTPVRERCSRSVNRRFLSGCLQSSCALGSEPSVCRILSASVPPPNTCTFVRTRVDGPAHHAEIVQITGKSYRLRNQERAGKDAEEPKTNGASPTSPKSKPASADGGVPIAKPANKEGGAHGSK